MQMQFPVAIFFMAPRLHFASIRSAGYSLEEIMGTDTSVLIDREDFPESEDEDSLLEGMEIEDAASEDLDARSDDSGEWPKCSQDGTQFEEIEVDSEYESCHHGEKSRCLKRRKTTFYTHIPTKSHEHRIS